MDPKQFHGLEQVADAVDYLYLYYFFSPIFFRSLIVTTYEGKNTGKVYVSLPAAPKSKL